MASLTRRDLLKAAGILGAGALLPFKLLAGTPARKRVLRFVHFSDIHVQPELKAGEGMAKALDHVNKLRDKPQLIITGGDLVMDAFGADYGRTNLQWELFTKTLRDHNGIRVEHCIGNHDVWGWSKREGNPVEAAKAGKKWAEEVLRIPKTYHSFNLAGWHFIILDSIHPGPNDTGYIGQLDNEQFEWLEQDLARSSRKTPVCVVSHIPILSNAVLAGLEAQDGKFSVSSSVLHADCKKLNALFLKHGNVKTCLSGHLHLIDRCDYNGISYFCNGAVCGAWWRGNNQQCQPGYAVMNLFDDGSVEREYHTWGWKAG